MISLYKTVSIFSVRILIKVAVYEIDVLLNIENLFS